MDENGNTFYEGVLCNGVMSTVETFTRSPGATGSNTEAIKTTLTKNK